MKGFIDLNSGNINNGPYCSINVRSENLMYKSQCCVMLSWGNLSRCEESLQKQRKWGKEEVVPFERWGDTLYTYKHWGYTNMWLHTYSCTNHNGGKWNWNKKGEDMHELGSVNKNRFNHDVVLDALSVWCCWVLVVGLQHVGMTWGTAYNWGALFT